MFTKKMAKIIDAVAASILIFAAGCLIILVVCTVGWVIVVSFGWWSIPVISLVGSATWISVRLSDGTFFEE